MNIKSLALILATMASASVAQAATTTISGLYDTGAGASDGQQDTHYRLTGTDGNGAAIAASFGYVQSDAATSSLWVHSTAAVPTDSRWLTVGANALADVDVNTRNNGLYTWTLNFTLGANVDPASASFAGRWSADNFGYIKLNGNLITNPDWKNAYGKWTDFSASSGFVAGSNTLEFVVVNARQVPTGNLTGLRVDFLSSSVVAAVPEPETWAMTLAGLALVGSVARRRSAAGR